MITRRWALAQMAGAAAAALGLPAQARAQPGASASSGARTALVIGNGAYLVAPLKNPVNDARLVASTLRGLGYQVSVLEDATLAKMAEAARDWVLASRGAGARFFFFAGHGSQIRGRNFLLPVDAQLRSEDELPFKALNATDLVDRLSRYEQGVNVVVLDACRNAPFPTASSEGGRTRLLGQGLPPGMAPAVAPRGTLIVYSTSPGMVAADGSGNASVFTRNLAEQMGAGAHAPVELVFKRVRTAVIRETNSAQVPWESSSLVGDFCLQPSSAGRCESGSAAGVVDLRRL